MQTRLPICRSSALALLAAWDDLVLDGGVEETISLAP
jgi:hypothetical protein